jgi:hypothetical protein
MKKLFPWQSKYFVFLILFSAGIEMRVQSVFAKDPIHAHTLREVESLIVKKQKTSKCAGGDFVVISDLDGTLTSKGTPADRIPLKGEDGEVHLSMHLRQDPDAYTAQEFLTAIQKQETALLYLSSAWNYPQGTNQRLEHFGLNGFFGKPYLEHEQIIQTKLVEIVDDTPSFDALVSTDLLLLETNFQIVRSQERTFSIRLLDETYFRHKALAPYLDPTFKEKLRSNSIRCVYFVDDSAQNHRVFEKDIEKFKLYLGIEVTRILLDSPKPLDVSSTPALASASIPVSPEVSQDASSTPVLTSASTESFTEASIDATILASVEVESPSSNSPHFQRRHPLGSAAIRRPSNCLPAFEKRRNDRQMIYDSLSVALDPMKLQFLRQKSDIFGAHRQVAYEKMKEIKEDILALAKTVKRLQLQETENQKSVDRAGVHRRNGLHGLSYRELCEVSLAALREEMKHFITLFENLNALMPDNPKKSEN